MLMPMIGISLRNFVASNYCLGTFGYLHMKLKYLAIM